MTERVVTSPLQTDCFDERHDEGDELADESRECEVPTPEQDGVEDEVVVWTAPPRLVEEGDREEDDDRRQHESCKRFTFI